MAESQSTEQFYNPTRVSLEIRTGERRTDITVARVDTILLGEIKNECF